MDMYSELYKGELYSGVYGELCIVRGHVLATLAVCEGREARRRAAMRRWAANASPGGSRAPSGDAPLGCLTASACVRV